MWMAVVPLVIFGIILSAYGAFAILGVVVRPDHKDDFNAFMMGIAFILIGGLFLYTAVRLAT